MSKYIKPTISLVSAGTALASTSSCSSSKADAELVASILTAMGFTGDFNQAFSTDESCVFPIDMEGYCKFSSAIQVFFS